MFNSRLNSPPTCGPALSASWPAITTAYKITLYVAIQMKTMIQNQGQQTQTHQQMKVVMKVMLKVQVMMKGKQNV